MQDQAKYIIDIARDTITLQHPDPIETNTIFIFHRDGTYAMKIKDAKVMWQDSTLWRLDKYYKTVEWATSTDLHWHIFWSEPNKSKNVYLFYCILNDWLSVDDILLKN